MMSAHPDLIAHAAQFPKSVHTLAPGLYGFVGFAASNVYVIEGADSLCVVDTTESTGAAANILAELRKVTDKPIEAIVYTHSHRDHISGATVFADGGTPEIIAWHEFSSDLIGSNSGPHKALNERARKQFGFGLDFPEERVNLGCGPGDRPVEGLGKGFLEPTRFISNPRQEMRLAGWNAELIHAPGETADHMLVWLPEIKALLSGDNFYHSFPNLYPIRGSSYREFGTWADSLKLMAYLEPEILAPGHTLPVTGKDAIQERLGDYIAAIRFVISETSEALNSGEPIGSIADRLRLPADLAAKPWLQEYYGKLSWSVKAYAAGTLGWFDGNPTDLAGLNQYEEATRFIELAGGGERVLNEARETSSTGWKMALCDRLINAEIFAGDATRIKIGAMRELADTEINATARNYLLVSAKDLEAGV